jgi:hypothetical protein
MCVQHLHLPSYEHHRYFQCTILHPTAASMRAASPIRNHARKIDSTLLLLLLSTPGVVVEQVIEDEERFALPHLVTDLGKQPAAAVGCTHTVTSQGTCCAGFASCLLNHIAAAAAYAS